MLSIELDNLDEVITALQEVLTLQFVDRGLANFAPPFRLRLLQRYLLIARQTQYAPSTLGGMKPKSRIPYQQPRNAADPGYGIDSRELLNQITQKPQYLQLDPGRREIFSDLVYAGRLNDLVSNKGPFAPEGFLDMTDEDWALLIATIGQELEKEWG